MRFDFDREFAALARWTYLDSASTGVVPARSAAVGRAFLEDLELNAKTPELWSTALARARAGFATLIGAETADIAFTKNATEGVNIVAAGLDAKPGDNIVLSGVLEHPANLTPWLRLREQGVEIRNIAPKLQAIDAEAMAASIDERTRAVAVSTVTFMPGYRTDLAPIVAAARAHGAFVLADATQSAGVLASDVKALGVDGLVTSTHKYLLGLYGQGFLWLKPEWSARLATTFVGAAGYRDPTAHPGDADLAWTEAAGARRFETGHAPMAAAIVGESLALLHEAGAGAVEGHVTGLAGRVADGLEAGGWPVNWDPRGQGQTQIVTVGAIEPGDLYGVSDERLRRLHEALNGAKVRHSARRGALRFAFHLYNSEADVSRVLEIANRI